MAKRRFVYSFEGLEPTMDERGMPQLGGFGFSAHLERELAKISLQKKLPQHGFDNFQTIGRGIIIDCGLAPREGSSIITPYHFVPAQDEPSFLLHFIDVPGNACNLTIDSRQIESLRGEEYHNWVEYHPHNVDSHRQAYALFSLFAYWANTVDMVLRP